MKRVVYRFDPLKLIGANLGIDPQASGQRFQQILHEALQHEWPQAEVEVWIGEPGCEVEGFDDPETARLRAEGLARAVRKAASWIRYH